MKKQFWLGAGLGLVALLFVACGQQGGGGGGGGGDHNPALSINELFDVSGAKAVAAASSATVSGSAVRSMQAANVTELLKLDASGEISSILSAALDKRWHPPISVIEKGPDGKLYIGFQWGVWVSGGGTQEGNLEHDVAFFAVYPSGTVEVVDGDIYGVGSWYGGSENGELPTKQVQFDGSGNIYYIGLNSTGNTLLKKKTPAGVISTIGSTRFEVRDFLVTDDGFVLFHGSNVGNWSIEWLKVQAPGGSLKNVFYNDGQGWLRAYYYFVMGDTKYVFLVGENLTLLDENGASRKYSGIVRVTLDAAGMPVAVTALYDDRNMYNEARSLGDQLTWGYWDPVIMTEKRFFVRTEYNDIAVPLSLEAGVTEEAIRAFIRNQFQSITPGSDTLSQISFEGTGREDTLESWQVSSYLDNLVNANIAGTTWLQWRDNNGLQGVNFGNAKQLLLDEAGRLYAVMQLDSWGSGTSRGDKLFRIVTEHGTAEPAGYPQDETNYYKTMNKVRAYRDTGTGKDYAIYLASNVGNYKIYRLDLSDASAGPVDMIPTLTDIEIFSFSFDAASNTIFYDVYDLSNNTSYVAEQELTGAAGIRVSAEGYTITDVVPFSATN